MRAVPPARVRLVGALVLVAVLCGCAGAPRPVSRGEAGVDSRAPAPDLDGPGANPPADLARLPDAEPRIEPIRAGGPNKPYQALGREYVPATRDVPFSERGLASWYGRKFHGRRTASGEVYDMYAMTAAHPTLPIPSYARIRNPANGREVLVRVNDRGPFVPGRIVDLSYAAALRLDLLRGVAPVELGRITFDEIRSGAWRGAGTTQLANAGGDGTVAARDVAFVAATAMPLPPPSPSLPVDEKATTATAPLAPPAPPSPLGRAPGEAARGFWVQLGAFRERDGAETFRRRVGSDDDARWLEPLLAIFADASLYRVQAGPYPSRDEAEGAALRARGALGIVPIVVERR